MTVCVIDHLITLIIDSGYYAYLMEFFSYSVLLSVTQYEVSKHITRVLTDTSAGLLPHAIPCTTLASYLELETVKHYRHTS